MIDPGQRRTRLTYQEPTYTIDSVGQQIETWADVIASVPARLSPLNAKETYWARQIHSETTHEVNIRFHPVIKPTGRFKVTGTDRVLNIVGIVDDENRHIELTISCVEQTPSENL